MGGVKLSRYFRWIIAGVLFVAGVLKIIDPGNLVEVILFFDFLSESYAYVFVYSICAFEITLAFLLVKNYKPKMLGVTVFGLCTLFFLISLFGFYNNWEVACGCLGRFSFGSFDKSMITRNFTLFLMAGWVLYNSGKAKVKLQKEDN